jgi:hypothetical protein
MALRSVPRDELAAAAREVAVACIAPAPGVVADTKALLRDALHPAGRAAAHDDQLAAERAAQGRRIREMAAMMGRAPR